MISSSDPMPLSFIAVLTTWRMADSRWAMVCTFVAVSVVLRPPLTLQSVVAGTYTM